jgi:hypothetical protein
MGHVIDTAADKRWLKLLFVPAEATGEVAVSCPACIRRAQSFGPGFWTQVQVEFGRHLWQTDLTEIWIFDGNAIPIRNVKKKKKEKDLERDQKAE